MERKISFKCNSNEMYPMFTVTGEKITAYSSDFGTALSMFARAVKKAKQRPIHQVLYSNNSEPTILGADNDLTPPPSKTIEAERALANVF